MSGYVYIFGALNQNESDYSYYKIGVTANPDMDKRLKSLQTGCPRKIELISAIQINALKTAYILEKHFHWKFSLLKAQGEWFQASPSFLSFVHDDFFKHGEKVFSSRKSQDKTLSSVFTYENMSVEEAKAFKESFFGQMLDSLN